MFDDYVIRQQLWEDYQEDIAIDQLDTAIETVNRLYNNKGYTVSDYEKYSEEY